MSANTRRRRKRKAWTDNLFAMLSEKQQQQKKEEEEKTEICNLICSTRCHAAFAGRPRRSQKMGCCGTGWPTSGQQSGAAACLSPDSRLLTVRPHSVSLSRLTMRRQPRWLCNKHFITLKRFFYSLCAERKHDGCFAESGF